MCLKLRKKRGREAFDPNGIGLKEQKAKVSIPEPTSMSVFTLVSRISVHVRLI